MSIENLAQDAFTAQTFTGLVPSDWDEGADDVGCTMSENQHVNRPRIEPEWHLWTSPVGPALENMVHSFDGPNLFWAVDDAVVGSGPPSVAAELNATVVALHHLIEKYRNRLNGDTVSTVRSRLSIIEDSREWISGEPLPNKSSFEAMLVFLSCHKQLRPPRVVLSRNGNFLVSWRAARDRLTTIEFQPGSMVRWLVFAPAGPNDPTKERGTGESTGKKILSRIRPYGALEWMK